MITSIITNVDRAAEKRTAMGVAAIERDAIGVVSARDSCWLRFDYQCCKE